MAEKLSRILDCKLKIDIDEDGTIYASINSPNFVLLGQGHSYDEAFTCLSEQLEIALSDLGEKDIQLQVQQAIVSDSKNSSVKIKE